MGREDRAERVSAARRRAETHVSGFETTKFRLPEGLKFWEWSEEKVHTVDIVPYTVKLGSDVKGGNPFAEKGELYFERTYWQYKKLGPDRKNYVCPSKTFGVKDFVQEYVAEQTKRKGLTEEEIANLALLKPKEMQLFLVYDNDHPDNGVQLFDFSFYMFGQLLDERVKKSRAGSNWDFFYLPGKDGMTLSLTFKKGNFGPEVMAIDFMTREKPLPDHIANHGFDLDSILVKMEYDKLKHIFLGTDDSSTTSTNGSSESASSTSSNSTSTETKKEEKKEEVKEEPKFKKEEQKKIFTAKERGLELEMDVKYKELKCSIKRISEDGLTMTLMDSNDDVHKNVNVADVVLYPNSKEKLEEKKEEKREETKVEKKEEAPFEGKKETKKDEEGAWDDDDDVWGK